MQMILAKARPAPPSDVDRPLSIAAVAAGVKRGAQLQLGEHELRRLRERRDRLDGQITEIAARHRSAGASGPFHEITALAGELREVNHAIAASRPGVLALRAERAEQVTAALVDRRREAARSVLDAIAALRAGLGILDEINVEVARAAGAVANRMTVPEGVAEVENLARRAAR